MLLKEMRKSHGMTQREVAEYLDIPVSTYRHYERERRDIRSDILWKLADLYGESTDALLGRQSCELDKQPALSAQETELVNLFRQIDDNDKEGFVTNAQIYAFAGRMKKEGTDDVLPSSQSATDSEK